MLEPAQQMELLRSYKMDFSAHMPDGRLTASGLGVMQINLGKKCNQACLHCHVNASPKRTEAMDRETAEMCMDVAASLPELQVVDLTGGAPEMNENFMYIVEKARALGKRVIDRCNLTILEEPGYEYLYDFLRTHDTEIVASLPHFSAARTDRQRGRGVFEKSITALKKLNELGYGRDIGLHLVYNPGGFFLSAPQAQLRREFSEKLHNEYGIFFNELYCINNLPVSRFLETLQHRDRFGEYMDLLSESMNPGTIDGLMCRNQISIAYDGHIYDCDFNQMLEIQVEGPAHIRDFDRDRFMARSIRVENHCFGCTAGAGSSCGGELMAS